jgi:hypothetical protein
MFEKLASPFLLLLGLASVRQTAAPWPTIDNFPHNSRYLLLAIGYRREIDNKIRAPLLTKYKFGVSDWPSSPQCLLPYIREMNCPGGVLGVGRRAQQNLAWPNNFIW